MITSLVLDKRMTAHDDIGCLVGVGPPSGWPQVSVMDTLRSDGRTTAQWAPIDSGRIVDLTGDA